MSDAEKPPLFGGYEVLELLSRARGTSVYRARQTNLGRQVTLTVLSPSAATRPGLRERFEREVAVAARLRHDNVVSAIDAGQVKGYRYVVTEFVVGRTLAEHLAAGESFDVAAVLRIGVDIANALAHVQSLGLVHRNVNTESIVLTEAGPAKLAGFSLAKVTVAGGAETWHERGPESAHYTSPEVARGDKGIDIRSDLYSLGCVLFHLLTGRPPFRGSGTAELFERHLHDEPPDPRQFRKEIPEAVARIVLATLRKDRAERPARADGLAKDLESARLGRAVPGDSAAKRSPSQLRKLRRPGR